MSNLAATFRQEISRLARREIRGELRMLRKTSSKFRRDIAKLRRDAAAMLAELSRLRRAAGNRPPAPPEQAGSAKIRFKAKGVLAHRKRLGLSAADFGRLIGVTGHTVYKWEHGASRPRNA